MSEDIGNPVYWAQRLANAREPHHAIFKCSVEQWRRIETKHREILARLIGDNDSILDAGCGWGRLLDLLPDSWRGDYLGIDLSPDFIQRAVAAYNIKSPSDCDSCVDFLVGDLRTFRVPHFCHWAVLISVRPMVRRNLGEAAWAEMEANVRRHASKLLFLEYDDADPGSVE